MTEDKTKIGLKEKIKKFFNDRKNVSTLLLIICSGVLVGMALNVALGFSFYNTQGILGAIVAIVIVHWMA